MIGGVVLKAIGFHAVPPPITGNFLTPRADISFAGKTNETNTQKPKTVYESVNRDKVIIEDWNSDDEDDVSEVQTVSPVKTNETQTVKTRVDKIGQTSQKQGIRFKKIKACFVCKSTDHLIKDCTFHDKQSQEPKLKTVVNTGPRVDKPVWDNTKRLITEASLRRHLKLEDAEGISSLSNEEIFEQLAHMGYVTNSESLTFFKGHFSPQWKFFIHTILHCLSSKKTTWDQFSSNIATAIICLATSRRFNFSKFIFEAMVKNLDSPQNLIEEEVHEKPSDETEVIVQEETPIEIIKEHGSGEKGEMEISTASPLKVTKVSTVEAHVYTRRSAKDKGKAIMKEPATPKKVKKELKQLDERQQVPTKATQSKGIDWNDPSVLRYHALKNKPVSIAQARRNMITYLKNQDATWSMEMKDIEAYKLNKSRWNFKLSMEGDLRMMFDPDEQDEIWKNQESWKVLRWKLYENSGVHSVFLTDTPMEINMLVEKKYPLKKEILEKMINLKLQAKEESTMAFELIKFTRSQIEEKQ
ncbi:hypothetical protein Tco_0951294 [Tanacetum coccineum]|uniref:Uncharacterized protein n=1 Tax=Tanacetum coccineum TaxID=301880 RepID=A0ABQ5E0F1_9ASTR